MPAAPEGPCLYLPAPEGPFLYLARIDTSILADERASEAPSILADPVSVVAPDLLQQRLDGGKRRGHARIQRQHNHVEELCTYRAERVCKSTGDALSQNCE